jgi:hypothetical protein
VIVAFMGRGSAQACKQCRGREPAGEKRSHGKILR